MTDHTDEELIALAKKCGANEHYNPYEETEFVFYRSELIAYAHALRQQDLARMARMREALSSLYSISSAFLTAEKESVHYDDKVRNAFGEMVVGKFTSSSVISLLCRSSDLGELRVQIKSAENALSETADIQEWMDGQRAQWQPIETAPKDGTFILVANRSGAWIACYRKYAGSGFEFPNPWMSMMLNHDHMERSERWDAPTHWMPLPAAPSARSTKGEG